MIAIEERAGVRSAIPKGLYILFFAEMWERFSYYGMRALLIFYLTQHWLFSDGRSNLIYGAYTSLVYITPVLGGYLADRYLGQRKAVLFGGILLALGHFLMAVEGRGGQADPTINIFWLALAFIIVGSGFLKANISVIVGQLYPLTDIRRDGAYTIFYMGINVGAAIGTILAGCLGQTYGWGYGFGAAGVGMLLGLVVFILGRPLLLGKGEAPAAARPGSTEWTLYGIGIAAVAVIWALVQYQDVIQNLLIVSGVALLLYVLYESFKLEPHARDRMFAILFLIALNPVFWGLFEQAGGSLNLYTDRYRRPRRRAGLDLPVDQPDLHRAAGADLRRVCGSGSGGAGWSPPRRPSSASRWLRSASPSWSSSGAPKRRRRRSTTPVFFVFLIYLPADHRRAVPVAGRPLGDEPAGAELPRLPDHGRLVLHDRGRQFRRRQDRRGDRRP